MLSFKKGDQIQLANKRYYRVRVYGRVAGLDTKGMFPASYVEFSIHFIVGSLKESSSGIGRAPKKDI